MGHASRARCFPLAQCAEGLRRYRPASPFPCGTPSRRLPASLVSRKCLSTGWCMLVDSARHGPARPGAPSAPPGNGLWDLGIVDSSALERGRLSTRPGQLHNHGTRAFRSEPIKKGRWLVTIAPSSIRRSGRLRWAPGPNPDFQPSAGRCRYPSPRQCSMETA